ncbi:MAG: proprotein convertase P-domain-containing protein [Calditrichaeota bacterium]|nr:proprotein convertase P-domain-containing protein [Calditrichota bacterium]MCB9369492.1 proprotein convertase P-domain-containing protein [Calditrichota bacterium]
MRCLFLILVLLLVSNLYSQSVVTFESDDVPVAIPDGPVGIVESYLMIQPWYVILDVNVVVTITHTYDQDLRLYIEAPNGDDVVRLAYECGLSGNNYIDTRFDDEASIPICSGSPPFTGDYIPDRALTLFDGLSTHGTWTLRVTDNHAGDVGVIEAWRMEVLVDTAASARTPVAAESFLILPNYPNPFNSTTRLPVELARPSEISLIIYNQLGQTVADSRYTLAAGRHDLLIDGSGWSTGVYFARIRNGNDERRARLILLK